MGKPQQVAGYQTQSGMNRIMFCTKCRIYTLKGYCSNCNEKTVSLKPARFSPEDKYSKYRLEAKREKGELKI